MNKPAVKRREINGILILDKGIGKSSNGALQEVKRLYNAKKAGHTGSLDPLATGVLPLCFGEATKFSQFLLDANKRYVTTIKLGVVTTTGDAEGEIVEEVATQGFSTEELESALEKFRGEIEQIPSMFSAIKVNGQPLYKLARQGIEIVRKSRVVSIFEVNLVENNGVELILDVSCSKGTYIRTLAEDLGKVLGCGAHVIALRRTQSGPFKLDEAYSLQALEEMKASGEFEAIDSLLLSPAAAVVDWPSVE
ncbi:MAG: tRNA pseudouridine(55) synthase TruB, partial [Pseudomonadales bacterium]